MSKINWTIELDNYIINNYQQKRAEDISNELGIKVSKIRQRIYLLKLKKPKRQRINIKHNYNEHFMDELNPNNTYFLGLLWADGWIEKRSENIYTIGLELTDYDVMHKLSKLLNCNLLVRTPRKKRSLINDREIMSKKEIYVIRLNGKYFANKFIQLGFYNKKKDRDYMPKIPIIYYKDFIRGYFDGDGYVSKSITKKCNKYQYIAGITNSHLNLFNIIKNYLGYGHIYKKRNIFNILFFKKEIPNLYNFIYQDTDLFIARKKKLMLDCIEDKDVY